MLFQLGVVQFEVLPVNLTSYSRSVGADFAAKDLIGAPRSREFGGRSDETITLEGVIFPHRFGGLGGLEVLQSIAVAGEPQMLIRGDGEVFGWYVIEKVEEKAEYLNSTGIGRKTGFTISLQAVPEGPGADGIMSMISMLLS